MEHSPRRKVIKGNGKLRTASKANKEVCKMAELIVKSKVKELVKSIDPEMRVSPEFYDALEEEIKALVEKAVKRAKAEGRKTLYARHV